MPGQLGAIGCVHAGPLHPHNCTLTPIDPLCTTIAGEIAMVDVGLFDAFNNPLPHEAARSLRVRFASADPPSPDPRARRGGGGGGGAPAGSDVVSAGFGGANAHAVGEWLPLIAEDNAVLWTYMGHAWKINYHTVRAALECEKRLKALAHAD